MRVEAKIKKRESFGAEPEVNSGDASSVASIAVRLPGKTYSPRPPPSLPLVRSTAPTFPPPWQMTHIFF